MKQNTEKPADPVMKFFPRELYVRLNSPREEEVDAAEAAWEEAVAEYESYLVRIRPEMPSHVRDLAEMYLHDAEFLAMTWQTQPLGGNPEPPSLCPAWTSVAALTVQQDGAVRTFVYSLWDRIREYAAPEDWPHTRSRRHWLCDEVVWTNRPGAAFLHRVLFSDGVVVEIPFATFVEVKFSLGDAMRGRRVEEQTAVET